jgi:2-C-methyl-D-erythritol 4-phosphate cytidylyltransferase
VVVHGGATRSASVRAGLAQCANHEVVVIHDAARPFATADLFRQVVVAVRDGADAAIPGLPVSDTIKRVRTDGDTTIVAETLSRSELVSVQTPQAFRFTTLVAAHANGGEATDDAALVESLGVPVVVIAGEEGNVKLTHPEDAQLLRRLT